MRVYYDLHLHSCLSPCGDNDMTPYNLVNMAAIQGLDIIALTDHNSSLNCPAALQVAKQAGIALIPGMELNTSEEAHVVCLFETLEGALEFDRYVSASLTPIQNDPSIFGEQRIMDAQDNILGTVSSLLIAAADISITRVSKIAQSYGGVAFPAHIDKSSYSILASLGDIPPECGFTAAEVTAAGDIHKLREKHPGLQNMPLLRNSDAHYLEHISEPGAWLGLDEISPAAVIHALKSATSAWGRYKEDVEK